MPYQAPGRYEKQQCGRVVSASHSFNLLLLTANSNNSTARFALWTFNVRLIMISLGRKHISSSTRLLGILAYRNVNYYDAAIESEVALTLMTQMTGIFLSVLENTALLCRALTMTTLLKVSLL
jgi:hypothetical protein